MKNSHIGAALGISGALCLAQAPMVSAQTTDPVPEAVGSPAASAVPDTANSTAASEPSIDEVVVTARRVEERLQDVPISITVYNEEQIANRNIANSNDLAIYTPSLSMNNTLGNASASFAIRGFVQDIGTAPSVGVYFADVVAPRGGSNNQSVGDGAGPGMFFDLQNVQVLKGPQGTLFGRNTTGGALLIVPQRPTAGHDAYLEGSIGNYNMRRVQGMFNAPLGESARFRIAVDDQRREGFVDNTTDIGPDKFNGLDYSAARASLVVDVTPDVENYTVLSYSKSDAPGEPMKLIGAQPSQANPLAGMAQAQLIENQGADFYSVQNDFPDAFTKLEQWQGINTTTWQASDSLSVKNIASYAELTYDLLNPVAGTRFDANDLNPQIPDGSYVNFTGSVLPPGKHTSHQSTFTEEFRLVGNALENRLDWQTGAYFESSKPIGGFSGAVANNLLNCPDQGDLCSNPIGFGAKTLTLSRKETQSIGLYAQSTYDLTEQLSLTGGLRYTWDKTEGTGILTRTGYPPGITPAAPIGSACTNPDVVTADCQQFIEQKSDAPTWLIDLDYKPTENWLLYAKYARGYRTGGVSLQAPTGFQTFDPEEVDAYELGLKTSFLEPWKGSFSVAAFYNDFRDQQLLLGLDARTQGSVAPATTIANAGASTLYGAEIEASIMPVKGLTFSLSYAYLDTKIDEIDIPQTDANSPYVVNADKQPHPGDPATFTPKNKYSISANYALPINTSWGSVEVGTTFTHSDKQVANYVQRDGDGDLSGPSLLQPRDLLDLHLNWNRIAGSTFDASLFGTNVTGDKYYTYILNTSGFQTAQLGNPSFYGLRLRYSWGS